MSLQRVISQAKSKSCNVFTLVIDGTHGADFNALLKDLIPYAEDHGFRFATVDTYSYLKSGTELRDHFRQNITDNRAFGYVAKQKIDEYFQNRAQRNFAEYAARLTETSSERLLFVVFGPARYGFRMVVAMSLLFLDVSLEYQEIAYKGSLLNFGFSWNIDAVEKYKIAYFVEWPLLEGYRKERMKAFDWYVDMNAPCRPVLLTVSDLLLSGTSPVFHCE